MARQVAQQVLTIRFWIEQDVDPRHPDEEATLTDLGDRIVNTLEEGDFGYEVECCAYSGAEYHLTPEEKTWEERMEEGDRLHDEAMIAKG